MTPLRADLVILALVAAVSAAAGWSAAHTHRAAALSARVEDSCQARVESERAVCRADSMLGVRCEAVRIGAEALLQILHRRAMPVGDSLPGAGTLRPKRGAP
jgi:hypothetical protein